MTKQLNIISFIIIASISISFSCSKYEDGPAISLLPKTTRLSREWKTEYSINLATGIEHSADFANWLLTIDKGGTFTNISIYNLLETTYTGNWELIGDNQIRFNYNANSGEQIEFYTILRLSKKELWVKNNLIEIHYYSD